VKIFLKIIDEQYLDFSRYRLKRIGIMKLMQIDPVRGVKEIAHEITQSLGYLFDSIHTRAHLRDMIAAPDWPLSVDISETDAEYLISGDIPGVNQDDVSITFRNGMLTIQGERKSLVQGEGRSFHRKECPHGYFMRSFRMPDDTEEKTITATFPNGMFNLTLPKTATPNFPTVTDARDIGAKDRSAQKRQA
jgi:HSP20 family protein